MILNHVRIYVDTWLVAQYDALFNLMRLDLAGFYDARQAPPLSTYHGGAQIVHIPLQIGFDVPSSCSCIISVDFETDITLRNSKIGSSSVIITKRLVLYLDRLKGGAVSRMLEVD
jgi:hypothetical protein